MFSRRSLLSHLKNLWTLKYVSTIVFFKDVCSSAYPRAHIKEECTMFVHLGHMVGIEMCVLIEFLHS